MNDYLTASRRIPRWYAEKLIADIPEDKMCDQPAPGMNHPAWILGHLAFTLGNASKVLGGEGADPLVSADLFAPGSEPVADPSRYPSKGQLAAALFDVWDRTAAALDAAPADRLDAPLADERRRQMFPTTGDMVVGLLTSHPSAHLGQLSAWRRACGMGRVF